MARRPEDDEEGAEAEEAAERQSPSSRIVHDAILAEGVEELRRRNAALAWSALAGAQVVAGEEEP